MIRIICGTCDSSRGLLTGKNGPVELPAQEEARLVRRGVAEYVIPVSMEPEETDAGPFPELLGFDDDESACEGLGVVAEETSAEGLPEGQRTGHLDPEQLKTMKLADLKAMAAEMDVDCTGLRSREDYANAIAAVEVILDEEAICDAEGNPLAGSGVEIVE